MGARIRPAARLEGGGSLTPAWLALGSVAGPVVFTLAWLVLGFVSPGFTIWGTTVAPYSPISAGISGLGLGPTAPYMNGAFVVSGLFMIAGAVGIVWNIPELTARDRWICAALLALPGVGLVTDGLFTLESIMIHLAGFILGVVSSVPGFLVVGLFLRRIQTWRRLGNWLMAASPITLLLIVMYLRTFSPTAEGAKSGVSGLVERVLVVEVLGWFFALGWLVFQRRRQTLG